LLLLLTRCAAPPALHSFPTRRSSDLVAALPRLPNVRYSGLALNRKGVERAHDAGLLAVDVSIATWDEHSLDNANMTVDEATEQADRKSTRLNSSHVKSSYAVFCLKKK